MTRNKSTREAHLKRGVKRHAGALSSFSIALAASLAVHVLAAATLVSLGRPGRVERAGRRLPAVPLEELDRSSGPKGPPPAQVASADTRVNAPVAGSQAPPKPPAAALKKTGRPGPRRRRTPEGPPRPRSSIPDGPPRPSLARHAGSGGPIPETEGGKPALGTSSSSGASGTGPVAGEAGHGPRETGAGDRFPSARRDFAMMLREAIRSRARYPEPARRRRIEGVVILGVRVDRQGRITRVTVAGSSGHAALDRAALSMARGLDGLPPPPGGPVEVRVPVEFTLEHLE